MGLFVVEWFIICYESIIEILIGFGYEIVSVVLFVIEIGVNVVEVKVFKFDEGDFVICFVCICYGVDQFFVVNLNIIIQDVFFGLIVYCDWGSFLMSVFEVYGY